LVVGLSCLDVVLELETLQEAGSFDRLDELMNEENNEVGVEMEVE